MTKFSNNDGHGYQDAEVLAIAGVVKSDFSDASYTWYIVAQQIHGEEYTFWATAVRDPDGTYRTIGSYGTKPCRQDVIDMCRDHGFEMLV